jgi:hypothetical protein
MGIRDSAHRCSAQSRTRSRAGHTPTRYRRTASGWSPCLPQSATDDTATDDFIVETDSAGNGVVYCNVQNATLRYIVRVTDTTKYSTLFTVAIVAAPGVVSRRPILKGKVGASALRVSCSSTRAILAMRRSSTRTLSARRRSATTSHFICAIATPVARVDWLQAAPMSATDVRTLTRSFRGRRDHAGAVRTHRFGEVPDGAFEVSQFHRSSARSDRESRRSQYVLEVKDSTKPVRLIPFYYNTDQTYVLEVGPPVHALPHRSRHVG